MFNSKRKPNLIKTDRGQEFYNKKFQDFLDKNNIKIYSRKTSLGAVFAERFNKTIRNLHKKPVFEKTDGNWINFLPRKTNQYNGKILSRIKLTPIKSSSEKNEGFICKNLLDKRKKIKPKFQINDLA